MSDLRERIARAVAGYMMTTEASEFSTFAMADAVLDALDLEQVGWMVWEDPESNEWSTVALDYEDLTYFPHQPFYRLGGSHE